VIVECPYCSTRYQLDPARLTGGSPRLKCSRCHRVFPAPSAKTQAPKPPPATKPREAGDHETLELPFDEPAWKDGEEAPAAFVIDEPEPGFTIGDEAEADDTAPATVTAAEPPRRRRSGSFDIEDEEGDDNGRTPDPKGPTRERAMVWAILIFLGLSLGAYGTLTQVLFANPALCDQLLRRLPLIGSAGGERLFTRKLALSDVVGSYQRIKDGKEVFVITGKALNTAPVPLQNVQIAGKLFNSKGAQLDQKVISCGNVISTRVLKDLTPRELSILQRLSPPKGFSIEPGGSSTFVIVFMDPPRDATEFSTQVVAAQRQA
jgi:predicted Zn finger-like uncharacterized protein